MMTRFVIRMTRREAVGAWRHLALLGFTVAVGVAASVSVGSFTDNLQASVRRQARALVGAPSIVLLASTLTMSSRGDFFRSAASSAKYWNRPSRAFCTPSICCSPPWYSSSPALHPYFSPCGTFQPAPPWLPIPPAPLTISTGSP